MTGKISLAINAILLIAVIYLFSALNKKMDTPTEVAETIKDTSEVRVYPSIAWVDNDSLQTKYEFIKDKAKDLEIVGNEIAELEQRGVKKQEEYYRLGEKIQRQMSVGDQYGQGDAAKFDKDVARVQQLEKDIPYLTQQVQKKYEIFGAKQAEINDTLVQRVNRFIESYSSDKPIQLILLYTQGVTGLYKTDELNLTEEVISGLNEEYQKDKAAK